jgi:hypothetical protein
MYNMTIKTKILTIFFITIAIVSSALLYSQYYFSKQVAIDLTTENFTNIAKDIDVNEEVSLEKDYSAFISFIEQFLQSGAYMTYANEYLNEDQIDNVNIEQYLSKEA